MNAPDRPLTTGAQVVARTVLALLVATIGSTIWLLAVDETYAATSSAYVRSTDADGAAVLQQGLYQQNRLQSFGTLARSTVVSERVVETTGLDVSASALRDQTTVQVLPQTVIMQFTVEDPDPVRAQALSTAIAHAVSEQVASLETDGSDGTSPVSLEVLDEAERPSTPASPDRLRVVLLFSLAGCLAALAVPLPRRRRGRPKVPTATSW